jgi:hypothetical protein
VPSGSVTVYVKSNVKFSNVGVAVAEDKLIDGAVFTIEILYQPEPFDIYNVPVDVASAIVPAGDIGLKGRAAGLATTLIAEAPTTPEGNPGSIIEVFDCESCIFRLPLSAPITTLESPVPIVIVLPVADVNGTFCTILYIPFSLFIIFNLKLSLMQNQL